MKTFFITCLLCVLAVFGYAQTQTPQERNVSRQQVQQNRGQVPQNRDLRADQRAQRTRTQEDREASRQRVQAHRVAFFTEKLALTPAEAEKFWALYNTYINEREKLLSETVQKTRPRRADGGTAQFDVSKLSDAEVKQLVSNKAKQFDLDRKFHHDLTKLFSPQRVLAFYDAEYSFQREMMNMRRRD